MDQHMRSHVGVANHALAIALLAESPQSNARLLPAKDQVGMMLSHVLIILLATVTLVVDSLDVRCVLTMLR
jgi:hypothetical protein